MIIKNKNILGESPIWDPLGEKFYWVDIYDKKIKSYDNTSIQTYSIPKMPTCITLYNRDQLFVAVEDGLGIYDLRNQSYEYKIKIDAKKVRFNDGKVDRNGVFHIGTMDRNEKEYIGSIYRYENNTLTEILKDIGISNGISFSKNNSVMYHADSLRGELYQNNKVFYKYEKEAPDGSTIDKRDYYYSCIWGGSRIDIFKDLKLYNSIPLEVQYPTCCCFGGVHENKLFITSASTLNSTGNNGYITILDL